MQNAFSVQNFGKTHVIRLNIWDLPVFPRLAPGCATGLPVALSGPKGKRYLAYSREVPFDYWIDPSVRYFSEHPEGSDWVLVCGLGADAICLANTPNPRMAAVGHEIVHKGITARSCYIHRDDLSALDHRTHPFCDQPGGELITVAASAAAFEEVSLAGLRIRILSCGDRFSLRLPQQGLPPELWRALGYMPMTSGVSNISAKIVSHGLANRIRVPDTLSGCVDVGIDVPETLRLNAFEHVNAIGTCAEDVVIGDPEKFAAYKGTPELGCVPTGSQLRTYIFQNSVDLHLRDFSQLTFLRPVSMNLQANNLISISGNQDFESPDYFYSGPGFIQAQGRYGRPVYFCRDIETRAELFVLRSEAAREREIPRDVQTGNVLYLKSGESGPLANEADVILRETAESYPKRDEAKRDRARVRAAGRAKILEAHGRLPVGYDALRHSFEEASRAIELENRAKAEGWIDEAALAKGLIDTVSSDMDLGWGLKNLLADLDGLSMHTHPLTGCRYLEGIRTAEEFATSYPGETLRLLGDGLPGLVLKIATSEDAIRRLALTALVGR